MVCLLPGLRMGTMGLYWPGLSLMTASRVAGSMERNCDSITMPRSPPLPEVSGDSEYLIARVAKSSPLSRRFEIILVFFWGAASFFGFLFLFLTCGVGAGGEPISGRM